jgi:hypothetical protein
LIVLYAKFIVLLLALQGTVWAQASAGAWVIGGPNGEAWDDVVERRIALDDTSRVGAIQSQEIPRGHSVLRELVRTTSLQTQANVFGYVWNFSKGPIRMEADTLLLGWNPRMWDAGGRNALAVAISRGLVDGDGLSPAFMHAERVDGSPTADRFFTLDLGVSVPIDSVSFYPPQSGLAEDGRRQRSLFPVAYEVSRANNPVDWLVFEDENASAGTDGYHPLEEILGSTFTNNTSIVSLRSSLKFTRFLRFKFGGVTSTGILAEVEAFGRGFPAEARYVSEPRSFGEQVSLGRITWQFTKYRQAPSGEVFADPTAPVELLIRTRAGIDDDPVDHFVFDEFGRQVRVARETYYDGPPPRNQTQVSQINGGGLAGFRASRSDDITNWNSWSVAYQVSGDEVRSSDGKEYLQFRFEIKTEDPLAFGVLDSVAFEVSPVLADSVIGEVSLAGLAGERQGVVEVPLGVDTLFAYDIRTVLGIGDRSGFDGIELDVPSGARFVSLERDGVELLEGAEFSQETSTGILRILFAEPIAEDTAVRLQFRSAVYQASIFLEGRIFNSSEEISSLPQSIESGDARAEAGSNGIQVVATEIKTRVLGDLRLSSSVITPNGDGVNEETIISFNLFDVNSATVRVEIYDMAGHRLATPLDAVANAGPYGPSWGGHDGDGGLVAPGIYLIKVEVDVDRGTQTLVKPVAVVY